MIYIYTHNICIYICIYMYTYIYTRQGPIFIYYNYACMYLYTYIYIYIYQSYDHHWANSGNAWIYLDPPSIFKIKILKVFKLCGFPDPFLGFFTRELGRCNDEVFYCYGNHETWCHKSLGDEAWPSTIRWGCWVFQINKSLWGEV